MSVRLADGVIVLEGDCPVDEAEALLEEEDGADLVEVEPVRRVSAIEMIDAVYDGFSARC